MPCSRLPIYQRQQHGAALVLALVAVLLVVALATRLGRDYWLLQRTVELELEQSQARAYLLGAEQVAQQALLLDLQSGQTIDSAAELWAQPRQLPLPIGNMAACLSDLQGRINLNDLSTPASEGLSVMQKRFIRLLQVLPAKALAKGQRIDEQSALQLANAAFDWVDADNEQRYPGGAEAVQYLQTGLGYKPANQAFTSVSELLLLAAWDAELVAALTPFVSVWGNGSLNINTVDLQLAQATDARADSIADPPDDNAEPMLLRTLNHADSLQPASSEAARRIASLRSSAGGVLNDLTNVRELVAEQGWELDGLGVASDFFQLSAELKLNGHRHQLVSVLQRNFDAVGRPQVNVVNRSLQKFDVTDGGNCAVTVP
jgi:general secretion pathway protein K